MSAWGSPVAARPGRAGVVVADMVTLSDHPSAVEEALRVLGVPAGATVDEAARRYRELMRGAHPDLHRRSALQHAMATERASRLNAAWAVVKPAAEALARHRVAVSEALRVRRDHAPAAGSTRPTARILRAREVALDEPRVIPVPDLAGALRRGA